MADIFISYKREDRDFAERLAHALEQLGFDVWWDFDLLAGDRYRKVIREVIDKCSAAIVLWSGKSVESDFVMDEAGHAKNRGKLCPARIDEVDLPFGFGQTHTDDLIGWDGELTHPGFQGLVRSLETRVGRKARLGATRRGPESQAQSAELEAFRAAQLADNVAALRTFLSQHPRGTFAGFVRGQIESMNASPPRAEVAEPPAARPSPGEERPPERSAPSPREQSAAGGPPPRPKPVTRRSLPWPKIAAIGIVAAALAGLYMYQSAQQDARRARVEVETQRKQAEDERRAREAAEARAKEVEAKAQSDRAAREEAERERIAMQKAEEQRLAREKAEREKAEREAERQRMAAAQAEQQRLAREQAQREREAREQAEREREAREAEARAKAATQPAPYDLAQLHPQVREAVERARAVERRAHVAATRAREAARKAEAAGVKNPTNGLGTYVWPSGDRYAGYFENGKRNGVGVYSYAEEKAATRYEGEYVNGNVQGVGVTIFRNGSRYAGARDGTRRYGPGVDTGSGGSRYEGEFANDEYSGYGVFWNSQGRVLRAGIWSANKVTTPLGPQGR